MRTRLSVLVLLIVCFSCGTNNKPVSDAQKEKIIGEVKEVVNIIIKGFEEADFDKAFEPFFDTPDFVLQGAERTYSYKEFMDMKPYFKKSILNEKHTLVDEKYAVLNNSTAIYSSNSRWVINYKDGHSSLADPEVMMLMFKKIDNRWRVTYYVDAYTEKIDKPSETPKELNQVELNKQWMGTWKWEGANDTAIFWDNKPYGTGLEGHIKFVSKGKVFTERKEFAGYNKEYDKYISAQMTKGEEMEMSAYWFTSKNRCTQVPFEYILNPEKASYRIEMEFKSPDMLVATNIVNNKTVSTDTVARVKQ